MGKYLKKSKIAGDVSVSVSDFRKEDSDSFRYLQLRSRRLLKLPLLADTKKHQKQKQKQKTEPPALVIETEEETGFDLKSGDRRESEAIETVPSSSEIEDFFAYAEQQQERFFIEKYNFDIVSDNPLPGRYEWVKVEP